MESFTYLDDLLAQLPEVPPDSIVSRTFFTGGGVKAILFGFAPGQELSEHTSAYPAVIHILKGQAQLTLGDQAFEAGEGAWAYMPPRMPHSVVASTPLSMLLLMFEAPVQSVG
jgi:quercetin dioxygenase-like cupin family protein